VNKGAGSGSGGPFPLVASEPWLRRAHGNPWATFFQAQAGLSWGPAIEASRTQLILNLNPCGGPFEPLAQVPPTLISGQISRAAEMGISALWPRPANLGLPRNLNRSEILPYAFSPIYAFEPLE